MICLALRPDDRILWCCRLRDAILPETLELIALQAGDFLLGTCSECQKTQAVVAGGGITTLRRHPGASDVLLCSRKANLHVLRRSFSRALHPTQHALMQELTA